MTIKIYTFVFLILQHIPIFSQNQDSLIKKSDLKYKNPEEQFAFTKNDFSNPDNAVGLLLSSYDKNNLYSDYKAIQQINDCVKTLKQAISQKSEVKK